MIEQLKECCNVSENASLKNYNTYRVESHCNLMLEPYTINDLITTLKILKENNKKYFILGNGSNLILNKDLGDLVIIKLSNIQAVEVHKNYNSLYAEAGAMLPKVSSMAIEEELTGLEFAIGIPGTVGGSIYGNAGAYNACLLDYVKSITYIDENLELQTIGYEDLEYGYRDTMFKKKDWIIVAVKFYLKDGDKENSLKLVNDRKERRLASQPLEYPSAGSVFRNPDGDFAGALIENCGLKGYQIGGARVSDKHANFVVNFENATSDDVHELINYVHDKVEEKTGVNLKREQEYIGWE